jgi:hypothetical protein
MSPPTDETPKKPPTDPEPEGTGGEVPRPPRVALAAMIGGAVGGFVGALAGTIVEAMAR